MLSPEWSQSVVASFRPCRIESTTHTTTAHTPHISRRPGQVMSNQSAQSARPRDSKPTNQPTNRSVCRSYMAIRACTWGTYYTSKYMHIHAMYYACTSTKQPTYLHAVKNVVLHSRSTSTSSGSSTSSNSQPPFSPYPAGPAGFLTVRPSPTCYTVYTQRTMYLFVPYLPCLPAH